MTLNTINNVVELIGSNLIEMCVFPHTTDKDNWVCFTVERLRAPREEPCHWSHEHLGFIGFIIDFVSLEGSLVWTCLSTQVHSKVELST